MRLVAFWMVWVGCYSYPDPNCPKPNQLEVDWNPSICPEPPRDSVRFTVGNIRTVAMCSLGRITLDVTMVEGNLPMTVEILSPSGQVLTKLVRNICVIPPEQTGDFQCYTQPYTLWGPVDAAVDAEMSDAGTD